MEDTKKAAHASEAHERLTALSERLQEIYNASCHHALQLEARRMEYIAISLWGNEHPFVKAPVHKHQNTNQ